MKKTLKTTAIFSLALGFLLCIVGLLCANVAPKAFADTTDTVTVEDFEGCEKWEEKTIEDTSAPLAGRYFKVKLSNLESSLDMIYVNDPIGTMVYIMVSAPGYEDGTPDAVEVYLAGPAAETIYFTNILEGDAIYFYVPNVRYAFNNNGTDYTFDTSTDGFYAPDEAMVEEIRAKLVEVVPAEEEPVENEEEKKTLGEWIDGLGEKASNFISTYTGVTISGGIIVLAVIIVLVVSFKRKR